MVLGARPWRDHSKKTGFVSLVTQSSSLKLTFIQPFTQAPGEAKPTINDRSWTNLSSILFVEQPVGTGFSQGTPTARVRYLDCSIDIHWG